MKKNSIAKAILSKSNLIHNIQLLKKISQQNPNSYQSKIVPIIKANAYGHGMIKIAKELEANIPEIYGLGVARIDEALKLRDSGIMAPIILLEGVFTKNDLVIAAEKKFYPVFHNQMQLLWLKESELSSPINAWLKIDTGMSRIGFSLDEAREACEILIKHQKILKPIILMSHFACADQKNHPLNQQQIDAFNQFAEELSKDGIQIIRSLNNSGGVISFPDTNYEIIRSGIIFYGYSPIQEKSTLELGLKPILTLQTEIIAIHNFPKGTRIGYGGDFLCQKDMIVAVAAIGYGDGYSRTIKSGAPVLVNKKRANLVGRVSMDMITIDITDHTDVKIGDPVILWGEDLPADELLKFSSCCIYDLLCGIQNRVEYVWKH